MTDDILDRAKAAADGLLPGEWEAFEMRHAFHIHPVGVVPGYQERIAQVVYWLPGHTGGRLNPMKAEAAANARFIAAAHNLWPEMIAEIERLRAERDRFETALREERE